MLKVVPNIYVKRWFDVVDCDGYSIGTWRTPKEARHKARMWYMYITTGDELYLVKEMK